MFDSGLEHQDQWVALPVLNMERQCPSFPFEIKRRLRIEVRREKSSFGRV